MIGTSLTREIGGWRDRWGEEEMATLQMRLYCPVQLQVQFGIRLHEIVWLVYW